MKFPVVILCEADAGARRIAGLSVIVRLVMAAHRAGAGSITVVSRGVLPSLEPAAARGVPVKTVPTVPRLSGPALVLSTRVLVDAGELRRLWKCPGRLVSRDGVPLPVGVLGPHSDLSSMDPWAGLPEVEALGVAAPVTDGVSAAAADRMLWASFSSSRDGWVDRRFNRPSGRWLSRLLVHTPVPPNLVSVVATALGLLAAVFIARGDYRSVLLGAILLQVSAIIDCVDGDLARVLFKESRVGRWLDSVGDEVVNIAVFVGIGVGIHRADPSWPVLPLAAVAVAGVAIAFFVFQRLTAHSEDRCHQGLERLVNAMANRDFSVLLLLFACLNKLLWFLWLAAIGSHLFWMAALGVLLSCRPGATSLNPNRESRS